MAASGDTGRRPVRGKTGTLGPRVVSALVLAPLALAAVWFGSPWLPALVTLCAAGMAWEWGRLCRSGAFGMSGVLTIAAVVSAVLCSALGRPVAALAVAVAGTVIVWAASRSRGDFTPALTALGVPWVALPSVALLWLAGEPVHGRATLFWILAVVWATDIGAYVVGRTIGGPKLAPSISPGKTWAGLAGGVASASLAGLVSTWVLGAPSFSPILFVSGALAVVEQFGDLLESSAKRRFGVKDSSSLIPGHGGLLDRLDGLLAVAPAVALLSLAGGSSVVTWWR